MPSTDDGFLTKQFRGQKAASSPATMDCPICFHWALLCVPEQVPHQPAPSRRCFACSQEALNVIPGFWSCSLCLSFPRLENGKHTRLQMSILFYNVILHLKLKSIGRSKWKLDTWSLIAAWKEGLRGRGSGTEPAPKRQRDHEASRVPELPLPLPAEQRLPLTVRLPASPSSLSPSRGHSCFRW